MRRALAILPLLALLLGCPRRDPPAADAAPGSQDAAPADASPTPEGGADDDEVRPVYPLGVKPDPRAARLCDALSAYQERRRAECCKVSPGLVLTSECTRMLSAALAAGALTLKEGALDACVAAVEATYSGCDWVGPFPPVPPKACDGLFVGALPAGARCRSSLECEGTLRCQGVGPTTPGKCGGPRKDGEACGGSTDPLAGYTRQSTLDARHPECRVACVARRCGERLADGAACASGAECREGSQCVARKCERRAPGKLGEACPGGVCEVGAECIFGKCAAKKQKGASCTVDFECLGGCVKGKGQREGACGMRCDVR